MNVAVVGYGIEGKVSADYFAHLGHTITICDAKENLEIPATFKSQLGPNHLQNLDSFDIIVRSAGINPSKILATNPNKPEIANKITSSLNEFLKVCPSKNVIGITGTKGKGTTATLVHKILKESGIPSHLGGNIGIAPLEMLGQIKPNDYVVLELSSFQLIDLKHEVPVAACLAIFPEHLNWHTDMAEYLNAKAQLFKLQATKDIAIYNANSKDSLDIASHSKGQKAAYDVPTDNQEPTHTEAAHVKNGSIYYQENLIMPCSEVAIPGHHNLENLCAAISIVWPITNGDVNAIKLVATTFKGLPHHMEFVAKIDAVNYYNDSYSTMPDATIAAIATIKEPKVLILGGFDKQLPFDNMISAIAKTNIRHIILIGSLAKTLEAKLHDVGILQTTLAANDMESIVSAAKKAAKPGDTILLSPGCAAKGDGYFIDNVDRGNQFKNIVNGMASTMPEDQTND